MGGREADGRKPPQSGAQPTRLQAFIHRASTLLLQLGSAVLGSFGSCITG